MVVLGSCAVIMRIIKNSGTPGTFDAFEDIKYLLAYIPYQKVLYAKSPHPPTQVITGTI